MTNRDRDTFLCGLVGSRVVCVCVYIEDGGYTPRVSTVN